MNNKKYLKIFVMFILLFSLLVIYTNRAICYTPTQNNLYVIQKDGKFGYINNKGKIIIQPKYDNAKEFSDGLAVVSLIKNGDSLYGYINEKGNIVINIKYPYALSFNEGLAPVASYTNNTKDNYKFGYINKSGNLVIDFKYTYCSSFSNDLACFIATESLFDDPMGKLGYINKSGSIVVKPSFDMTITRSISFYDGIACVSKGGNRLFIDSSGNNIFKERVFSDAYNFSENLAGVKDNNNMWGFINKDGTYAIKPAYEDINSFTNGLASVKINGKWGFINKSGKYIIKPKYEDADIFSEGLAAVKVNQKWGYINKSGKFVIKPTFDSAYEFSNGIASVSIGDLKNYHSGYINTKGQYIWRPTK